VRNSRASAVRTSSFIGDFYLTGSRRGESR